MIRRKKTGGVNPLVQLVVLLVAIALLGLLGYRQYVRLGHAKKPVVVTASALPEGAIIQPKHIQILQLQEKNIPEGAFVRASDVIGRKVTRAKAKGDPLAAAELQPGNAESTQPLSKVIPTGRVLTSLTLMNPTVPYQNLTRGDRIDILIASTSTNRTRGAQVVARDVCVMGYTQPRNASLNGSKKNLLGIDMSVPTLDEMMGTKKEETALLLAVNPSDVIPLASIDGMSTWRVILVLHGEEEVKKGELLAIERPVRPVKTVDVIVGVNRQKVSVP